MKFKLCGIVLATFMLGCVPLFALSVRGNDWAHVEQIKLNGYLGSRIKACINNRVKTQDINEITEPFQKQDETQERWQSEFWGKWVQGAMACYRYSPDSELLNMIRASEKAVLDCQLADGYIGDYDKAHQLKGWDVWGRKYTTLGLLKWYDMSGEKKYLQAACRLIDYTISQIGPGGTPIYTTGNYKGMASSSILEPVMLLYERTRQQKYLDFAKHIVTDWEKPGGAQLFAKVDVPLAERFPVPSNRWWSNENGQKAYEMMSCYVGVLELYKVTHEKSYLEFVERVARHIVEQEINICGSGAAYECWYHGKERQTRPSYHSMETCVTFTWMQLNERLLQITGNPFYADNLERTAYNALMASMKGDASQIAKYIPLEGARHPGEEQCGLHINCCNANGPRAFAMIPRVAYMVRGEDSVDVNLYEDAQVTLRLGGRRSVDVVTRSNYPLDGHVEIALSPDKPVTFCLSLRIPAWSKQSKVSVNGEVVADVKPGSYCRLNRTWSKGDKVTLELDMATRVVMLNDMQALTRGPIAWARDSRFLDGFVDETCVIQQKNGVVNARLVSPPDGIWMALEVNAVMGTDLEGSAEPRKIHFCDFASAGNTWNDAQRYRVWLVKTMNAREEPR